MTGTAIESLAVVLLLVLIAYLATDRLFRVRRLSNTTGALAVYGIEFIILGIIIGRTGLKWVDPLSHAAFRPLIIIMLAWSGLLFGMQFKRSFIKMLPFSAYRMVAIEGVGVALGVFIIMILVTTFFYPTFGTEERLIISLALSACATASSPAVVGAVVRQLKSHGYASKYLRILSALDGGIGVIIMAITLSLGYFLMGEKVSGIYWILSSLFLGIVLGYLFKFLFELQLTSDQRLALAAGMIAFTAGVAFYFPVSPLLVGVIAGVTLINISVKADHLYRLLVRGERALYGLLLIIAGASWVLTSRVLFIIIILYVVTRFLIKIFATRFALRTCKVEPNYKWVGMALLAEGGITLAMVFDFAVLIPNISGEILLGVIVVALAINNIFGPMLVSHALKKSGEVNL